MTRANSHAETRDGYAAEKENVAFLPDLKKIRKNPLARRKRKSERGDDNVERWLVSYADFITLLFAFFVTLYSISKVDQQKLSAVAHSLQQALGSESTQQAGAWSPSQGIFPAPFQSVSETPSKNGERIFFEKLAYEIQKGVKKVSDSGNRIQYIINEGELIIRVPDCIFFDSGQSSTRPEVVPILNVLGRVLVQIPNSINVGGHTDNVPIHTPLFQSNWELSSARATAIIRYFLTHFDFDPFRLSAEGFAEFRPVAENDTAEGRMKNRRVDLVILSGRYD